MLFDFVLVAFAAHGNSPLVSGLRNMSQGYQFAPLASDGSIYTADIDLWLLRGSSKVNNRAQFFCPQHSTIVEAIKLAKHDDSYFVVALTHLAEFDPPGTSGVHLQLESWPKLIEGFNNISLTDVGFDVVDQWTGLSALANVGYGADDLVLLKSMRLQTNQFGLLATESDATKFVNFASVTVPEHAPFIPVKILVRIPKAPVVPLSCLTSK